MDEQAILQTKLGEKTIQELSALTFLQWVAKKLNNLQAYDSRVQELSGRVAGPVLGRMTDDEKIRIVRKMIDLGIEIK